MSPAEPSSIEAPPAPAVHASLGYKLLLALMIVVAIWLVTGVLADRFMPASAWRSLVAIVVPLVFSIVAGTIYLRRIRARFERLFRAAEQLARADWETPIAVPAQRRLFDETDAMLAQLEAVRTNTQSLLGQIDEAGARVHSSSVGLSQTAQDFYHDLGTFSTALDGLRRGAEEQSVMTEEMQEGMATVAQNAQAHRTQAEASEAASVEVRQQVADGGHRMEAVLKDWERTLSELRSAGAGIEDFEDTAMEIGSVVEIIAEVAQRTNTLSLNASLEAARAGEHGEGFAVLAVEIRSLAEDTTRRADAIAELLRAFLDQQRSLLGSLSRGIHSLDESRQEVGTIRGGLQEIVAAIAAIAERIVGLARGFDGLAEHIAAMRVQAENVHRISRQHAQVTREAVQQSRDQMLVGADQLLHEGRNLDRISRDLTTLVGELRQRGES